MRPQGSRGRPDVSCFSMVLGVGPSLPTVVFQTAACVSGTVSIVEVSVSEEYRAVVARRSGWRRRAHRADGVGLVTRRVTAAIGRDVYVIVVVGGFVPEVCRPAWLADPGVDLLSPDDVVDSPPFGVSQGITGDPVAEFDAFR